MERPGAGDWGRRFASQVDLRWGPGARRDVAAVADELGLRRVLWVSSRRFLATPFATEAQAILGDRVVGIAELPLGEPEVDDVGPLAASFRAVGADSFLAIGSGSAFGLVKLAAVDAVTGAFADLAWRRAPEGRAVTIPSLPDDTPPIVALPTVAGSGSEVNGFGSVRRTDRRSKVSLRGPQLAPRATLLDPELSVSAPASLTVGASVNALSHCVEALYSLQAQPFGDALALGGAALLAEHLPKSIAHPDDLDARLGLLQASVLGSLAFSHAMLGLHAAMNHAVAIRCDVSYPDVQAVLFPHVLRHQATVIAPSVGRVCRSMGLEDDAPVDALARWVEQLGGPRTLRELGVERQLLPELAEIAAEDRCVVFDPRCRNTADDLEEVYEQAW